MFAEAGYPEAAAALLADVRAMAVASGLREIKAPAPDTAHAGKTAVWQANEHLWAASKEFLLTIMMFAEIE